MLTRLKVNGFKNLESVDVRFGPFTCVAGPNGVGKSNLFDAIAFLSALADKPLMEAALAVRGGESRRGDVRSLFQRSGHDTVDRMSFEVEMLIPTEGEDPLGQRATASMTFLRYQLELRYRPDAIAPGLSQLEVSHERMEHINRSDAKRALGFPHKKAWRDSVVVGRRTSPYISTDTNGGKAIVSLHTDSQGGKGGGRPRNVPASGLPRTMLSSVNNATEHRTLVLARQEMMSWMQLQLEPSALRQPDDFTSQRSIAPTGEHLPATLHELAQAADRRENGEAENVYTRIANRLSELVENVRRIHVDVDDKRQLLSIVMTDRHGTQHLASALSDGTLRFLALTVMEADALSRRLVCLEEPENGMHPSRIQAVIELLKDMAVDPDLPVDSDNPLRQVIVNTHSPSVVAFVPDDCLLVALAPVVRGDTPTSLAIRFLTGTWRSQQDSDTLTATRDDLAAYLNPFMAADAEAGSASPARRRVLERQELTPLLPFNVSVSNGQ